MALPNRKPVEDDPARRWRCPSHTGWVSKTFACANCGGTTAIEAAHVTIGGVHGMGLKTDDWRVVPLCGPSRFGKGCHGEQHRIGEPAFWKRYEKFHGQNVEDLIASLCKASPKAAEITKAKRERGHG